MKKKKKKVALEARKHFILEKFLELLIMAEDLRLDLFEQGLERQKQLSGLHSGRALCDFCGSY